MIDNSIPVKYYKIQQPYGRLIYLIIIFKANKMYRYIFNIHTIATYSFSLRLIALNASICIY